MEAKQDTKIVSLAGQVQQTQILEAGIARDVYQASMQRITRKRSVHHALVGLQIHSTK